MTSQKLQVQSFLTPIVKDIGWEDHTQVRLEFFYILKYSLRALNGENTTAALINAFLDKWSSQLSLGRRRRILNVVSGPKVLKGAEGYNLELVLGFSENASENPEYRISIHSEKSGRIKLDKDSVRIDKISPGDFSPRNALIFEKVVSVFNADENPENFFNLPGTEIYFSPKFLTQKWQIQKYWEERCSHFSLRSKDLGTDRISSQIEDDRINSRESFMLVFEDVFGRAIAYAYVYRFSGLAMTREGLGEKDIFVPVLLEVYDDFQGTGLGRHLVIQILEEILIRLDRESLAEDREIMMLHPADDSEYVQEEKMASGFYEHLGFKRVIDPMEGWIDDEELNTRSYYTMTKGDAKEFIERNKDRVVLAENDLGLDIFHGTSLGVSEGPRGPNEKISKRPFQQYLPGFRYFGISILPLLFIIFEGSRTMPHFVLFGGGDVAGEILSVFITAGTFFNLSLMTKSQFLFEAQKDSGVSEMIHPNNDERKTVKNGYMVAGGANVSDAIRFRELFGTEVLAVDPEVVRLGYGQKVMSLRLLEGIASVAERIFNDPYSRRFSKSSFRILVVGLGAGANALAAFHQTKKSARDIQGMDIRIELDAVDVDKIYCENTKFNFNELSFRKKIKRKDRVDILHFEDLTRTGKVEGEYDLVVFDPHILERSRIYSDRAQIIELLAKLSDKVTDRGFFVAGPVLYGLSGKDDTRSKGYFSEKLLWSEALPFRGDISDKLYLGQNPGKAPIAFSSLSAVFEKNLWKGFTVVSTIFHELGHFLVALFAGQRENIRAAYMRSALSDFQRELQEALDGEVEYHSIKLGELADELNILETGENRIPKEMKSDQQKFLLERSLATREHVKKLFSETKTVFSNERNPGIFLNNLEVLRSRLKGISDEYQTVATDRLKVFFENKFSSFGDNIDKKARRLLIRDIFWEGQIRGIYGYPKKIGGILGNIGGVIFIGTLYFTGINLFELLSSGGMFFSLSGGMMLGVLVPGLFAVLMNYFSVVFELVSPSFFLQGSDLGADATATSVGRFEIPNQLSRYGNRIDGGVSVNSLGSRERLIIDSSLDPDLRSLRKAFYLRFYRKLLKRVGLRNFIGYVFRAKRGDRRAVQLPSMLKGEMVGLVYQTVEQLIIRDREWSKILAKKYKGQDILIGKAAIAPGKGVCRHHGVITAFLLEDLLINGYLRGSVYYRKQPGYHGWCEYRTSDGREFVLDVSKGYFGAKRAEYDEYEMFAEEYPITLAFDEPTMFAPEILRQPDMRHDRKPHFLRGKADNIDSSEDIFREAENVAGLSREDFDNLAFWPDLKTHYPKKARHLKRFLRAKHLSSDELQKLAALLVRFSEVNRMEEADEATMPRDLKDFARKADFTRSHLTMCAVNNAYNARMFLDLINAEDRTDMMFLTEVVDFRRFARMQDLIAEMYAVSAILEAGGGDEDLRLEIAEWLLEIRAELKDNLSYVERLLVDKNDGYLFYPSKEINRAFESFWEYLDSDKPKGPNLGKRLYDLTYETIALSQRRFADFFVELADHVVNNPDSEWSNLKDLIKEAFQNYSMRLLNVELAVRKGFKRRRYLRHDDKKVFREMKERGLSTTPENFIFVLNRQTRPFYLRIYDEIRKLFMELIGVFLANKTYFHITSDGSKEVTFDKGFSVKAGNSRFYVQVSGNKWFLLVPEKSGKVEQFALDRKVSVGRSSKKDNDIVVKFDEAISREHFSVTVKRSLDGAFIAVIEDLGSLSGTGVDLDDRKDFSEKIPGSENKGFFSFDKGFSVKAGNSRFYVQVSDDKWFLLVPEGSGRIEQFGLDRRVNVGRSSKKDNDIVVKFDETISRKHFSITVKRDRKGFFMAMVEDLGSLFGIHVDIEERKDFLTRSPESEAPTLSGPEEENAVETAKRLLKLTAREEAKRKNKDRYVLDIEKLLERKGHAEKEIFLKGLAGIISEADFHGTIRMSGKISTRVEQSLLREAENRVKNRRVLVSVDGTGNFLGYVTFQEQKTGAVVHVQNPNVLELPDRKKIGVDLLDNVIAIILGQKTGAHIVMRRTYLDESISYPEYFRMREKGFSKKPWWITVEDRAYGVDQGSYFVSVRSEERYAEINDPGREQEMISLEDFKEQAKGFMEMDDTEELYRLIGRFLKVKGEIADVGSTGDWKPLTGMLKAGADKAYGVDKIGRLPPEGINFLKKDIAREEAGPLIGNEGLQVVILNQVVPQLLRGVTDRDLFDSIDKVLSHVSKMIKPGGWIVIQNDAYREASFPTSVLLSHLSDESYRTIKIDGKHGSKLFLVQKKPFSYPGRDNSYLVGEMEDRDIRMTEQQITQNFSNTSAVLRSLLECFAGGQHNDLLHGKLPVDIVVDLSVVPIENLEDNLRTLAYLVLYLGQAENVNFVFKNLLEFEESMDIGLAEDIKNAPQAEFFVQRLRELIKQISFTGRHRDIAQDVEQRIVSEQREESFQVVITSGQALEWRKSEYYEGDMLGENEYPVAFTGRNNFRIGEEKFTAFRDFDSAFVIGLQKAQLLIARDSFKNEEEFENFIEQNNIVGKMNSIYRGFVEEQEIFSLELIKLWLDSDPLTRMNRAIDLSLPPVVRMPVRKLKRFHNRMQRILMAA